MKAVYIVEPGKVEIRDIPAPVRKKGEALLRVLRVGICGSDLGSYRGTFAYFDYPRIPGHEFSAEIVEIDDNDLGFKPGMIVTADPYFNCGECYSCKRGHVNACMDNRTMGCQMDGALCEYITMPIERLVDGRGLTPDQLAVIEPMCIGYHGMVRAGIRPGENVLIFGGGTIGVMAGISAKSMGANVYISDIIPEKLERDVEMFGFAGSICNTSPEALMEGVERITGSTMVHGKKQINGFDVTAEAVGLPQTFQNAIDSVAFGGRVAVIGVSKKNLDFNFTLIQKKEIDIYGSRNAMKKDFEDLVDRVVTGKIDVSNIVSAKYSFDDSAKAFEAFSSNHELLKVLISL